MRILVISDIHANRPALAAIREPFDICLCLGDLVEYGVEPGPCIEWVRANARACVRGNHDHGIAQDVPAFAAPGFKFLTAVTRPLNRAVLAPADRRYLADLPTSVALTLGGLRYLLVHASPRDPLDEYAPPEVEFWERRPETHEFDIICVGHTHQQYWLQAHRARVINPGAVGIQRDGDPRAGYALITDGQLELKRVEYPVEEAVRAVEDSALPEEAKRLLAEVYRNGKLLRTNGANGTNGLV